MMVMGDTADLLSLSPEEFRSKKKGMIMHHFVGETPKGIIY